MIEQNKDLMGYFPNWEGPPIGEDLNPTELEIVQQARDFGYQKVLDVGCGFNRFKPHLNNLIGIDLSNPRADINKDILDVDFDEGEFDLIIAMNSIHFGDLDNTYSYLEKMDYLLASGGRMIIRMNPSLSDKAEAEHPGGLLIRSPVTPELVLDFADRLGLEVLGEIVYLGRLLPDRLRHRGTLRFIYQKP